MKKHILIMAGLFVIMSCGDKKTKRELTADEKKIEEIDKSQKFWNDYKKDLKSYSYTKIHGRYFMAADFDQNGATCRGVRFRKDSDKTSGKELGDKVNTTKEWVEVPKVYSIDEIFNECRNRVKENPEKILVYYHSFIEKPIIAWCTGAFGMENFRYDSFRENKDECKNMSIGD